ncbi:hypothetical protein B0T16DRAFT_384537 [Cercophora newfieldiana]|uniref:Aminoglycoside phosphotransferase domain-containing protein n=1 Tax=Cercophora newfieldiana TaxID=92897 RepID=A0AA40CY04_9PEZI|nr:hypothetical protein B0T16DRAFT_384537 [Cercophora newfieldiana]
MRIASTQQEQPPIPTPATSPSPPDSAPADDYDTSELQCYFTYLNSEILAAERLATSRDTISKQNALLRLLGGLKHRRDQVHFLFDRRAVADLPCCFFSYSPQSPSQPTPLAQLGYLNLSDMKRYRRIKLSAAPPPLGVPRRANLPVSRRTQKQSMASAAPLQMLLANGPCNAKWLHIYTSKVSPEFLDSLNRPSRSPPADAQPGLGVAIYRRRLAFKPYETLPQRLAAVIQDASSLGEHGCGMEGGVVGQVDRVMSDDEQDMVPDQKILLGIFPEIPAISEGSYTIISNTFDRCTFRLSLDAEPRPDFPADLLVRLETSGSRLQAVAELQRLAHSQLSELVPATLEVGTVVNDAGRKLDYSITRFITGTAVLEDVWDSLDRTNQLSLMDLAVIHQVFRCDVGDGPDPDSPGDLLLGGPDAGYHGGIKEALAGLINESAAALGCEVVSTADGITVHSAPGGGNDVELTQSDLENLLACIVFCHNDLEPRNILVKKMGDGEKDWYELAAIIDWELAGFFLFAYEYWLKDTLLGSSNMSFSWYSLFKERAAALLPAGEVQGKLIKALSAIAYSNLQAMPKNVGVRVQAKWRVRERLVMPSNCTRGWVREDGATNVPVFTKQDNEDLEVEVLKGLGY